MAEREANIIREMYNRPDTRTVDEAASQLGMGCNSERMVREGFTRQLHRSEPDQEYGMIVRFKQLNGEDGRLELREDSLNGMDTIIAARRRDLSMMSKLDMAVELEYRYRTTEEDRRRGGE